MTEKQNVTFFRSKNCGGSCPTSYIDDSAKWLSECICEQPAEILIRDHNGTEILRDRMSKKKKMQEVFQKQFKNTFNMKKTELTKEEKKFLNLSESEVYWFGARVKQAAIANKDCSDAEFLRAILFITNGAIVFKRHQNGKQVSFSKCNLFRLTHSKKHPGRISYEKIDECIVKIHREARAFFDHIQHQKKNASELIDQVVNSIVFHFYADVETKQYLAEHGQNLDSDIADLTNNIVTVRFSAKEIHLSAITGSAITVNVKERMSKDHLQRLLKAMLTLIYSYLAFSKCTLLTVMKIDVASAMFPTFFREIGKDDEFIQQIKECITGDWFGLHSKA